MSAAGQSSGQGWRSPLGVWKCFDNGDRNLLFGGVVGLGVLFTTYI
jgi:hypothetical protein